MRLAPSGRPVHVLAFVDYYLPGFRAGGPARSVSRLAERTEGKVVFRVFTRDHDLGSSEPYPDVLPDTWKRVGAANVFYASSEHIGVAGVKSALSLCKPEVVYLNSCFSKLTRAVLLARRTDRSFMPAILLAPRGELAEGALGLKSAKKRAYLWVAKALGLYRGVVWHASSEREREDIERVFGLGQSCVVRPPDLSAGGPESPLIRLDKQPGQARFVFLARISRMKNLEAAIRLLASLSGDVVLTVYGPAEDKAYFEDCKKAVRELPPNAHVEFSGPVAPDGVSRALSKEHFFLLPTLGENFGHSIGEALAAGCPAIISDRTPWTNLEAHGAGWTLPLESEGAWIERLQRCVDMGTEEFCAHSSAARAAAQEVAGKCEVDGMELFEQAISLAA